MAYYQLFNQLMYLIGKEVSLNRGKPGACTGKLVSVQSDYLAIQTKNNRIMYYRLDYISTLSESRRKTNLAGYKKDIRIVAAYSFVQVIHCFRNYVVQIDYCGPDLLVGVVVAVSPNEIVVVKDGKTVKQPLAQVRCMVSPIQ